MDLTKLANGGVITVDIRVTGDEKYNSGKRVNFSHTNRQVAVITGATTEEDLETIIKTNYSLLINERHEIKDGRRSKLGIFTPTKAEVIPYSELTSDILKDLGDFYVYFPTGYGHKYILQKSSEYSVYPVVFVSREVVDNIKYIYGDNRQDTDYSFFLDNTKTKYSNSYVELIKRGKQVNDAKTKKTRAAYPILKTELSKSKTKIKKSKKSLAYYEKEVEYFKEKIAYNEMLVETLEKILDMENKGELMLLTKNDDSIIAKAAAERLTVIA